VDSRVTWVPAGQNSGNFGLANSIPLKIVGRGQDKLGSSHCRIGCKFGGRLGIDDFERAPGVPQKILQGCYATILRYTDMTVAKKPVVGKQSCPWRKGSVKTISVHAESLYKVSRYMKVSPGLTLTDSIGSPEARKRQPSALDVG
jgi:hypothetical protein